MVNNIYLRLLNDVDVQLSPSNVNNNISIRTPDDLIVDLIQPKRLVAIGESYEGLMFPVGSYEDYGMVKVNDDTGLIITNGILEIEANRFVEKNQGVENKDKFLYVKPDGTVGLTNTGVPIKTSDLENDGEDGINPFITAEDIPTKLSQFANDMGYVIPADLPSKTSDLYNDSDFVSRNDSDFISRSEVPTKTSDLINDGEGDTSSGARFATLDDAEGLISIQSISVNGDTQYPDQNKCVSLTIPTEYAVDIEAEISPNDYVMTLQLKNAGGGYIGGTAVVDLPLETMVVDGRYDSANQAVVLILANGSEVSFPVADLVAGLQTEITSTNKLDANLVDDTNAANKFMTSAEKTKLAGIAAGAEVNPSFEATATNIKMNGTQSVGSLSTVARADHVHPSDTSKQNVINTTNKLDADYIQDGSTNKVFTATEKTKLSGIASGAEVNVQSDWNQTDSTADDYIKNKPTIPAGVIVDTTLDTTSSNAIANSAVATAVNNLQNTKQNALSQTQLDAVNSGIDSTKVAQIATNTSNITNLQNNKIDLSGYGRLANMNNVVIANKTFYYDNGTTNQPNGETLWGTVVYNCGTNNASWVTQLVFPNEYQYFYRREYVNGAWKTWHKISETPTQVLDASGSLSSFNLSVENTSDTWFPVLKNGVFEHRTLENMMASSQAANAEIARNHRETWDTGRNDDTQGNNSGWYQFLKITKPQDWSDQSYIISLQSLRWADGAVGIFNIKVRWGNTDTPEGCNIKWMTRYNIEEGSIIGVQEGSSIRFYVYCNQSNYQMYRFKIISAYGQLNYGTRSSDALAYPTANYTSFDSTNSQFALESNWTTGGTRTWYAMWKIEVPMLYGAGIKKLKIIGGFTPSEEGKKTVWFRMNSATGTDVFETDCIGFYSVGIRTGSTGNGWQYATWSKREAMLTQISTGSVWFAIGY